jgi:Domain of unknown function (DUF4129)
MSPAATLAAIGVALAVAPAAAAASATPGQVAALAERAGSDPQALAALREIDRVGGRRVDLGAALDASGPELSARLRVLAASAAAKGGPSTDARSSARDILSERRFRGSDVPRPLHRPLAWLGDKLRRFFDWISAPLPGDGALFWTIVAALVVATAAYVAARLGQRRAGLIVELGTRGARRAGDDPGQLEREAARAEREGDFELALRLRFRAGLVRLGQRRALPARTSLTNGEIGRRLHSESFRGLARDFDEVVYGRRPAEAEDVDRARTGWPRVLEEAMRA